MSSSKGLYSNQIEEVLRNDDYARNVMGGVIARNELSKVPTTPTPLGYVVNTKPSSHPGEHWVAVYLDKDPRKPAEFFDSLGNHPRLYGQAFLDFLNYGKRGFVHLSSRLQGNQLPACGHYAIYFVLLRARGVNFEKIDFPTSDSSVMDIVSRYQKCLTVTGQTCTFQE